MLCTKVHWADDIGNTYTFMETFRGKTNALVMWMQKCTSVKRPAGMT